MMAGYDATLHIAAFFDISDCGKVSLTGPDAAAFLNNISTNDTVNLPVSGGCETYFLDHRAKVLVHAKVRRASAESFHLDTAAGYSDKLVQHLGRYQISEDFEINDVTASLGRLHVAGPNARQVLEAVTSQSLDGLSNFNGIPGCGVRRNDLLGGIGYDIFFDIGQRDETIESLRVAGAAAGSSAAFDILRIEAGTPVYGKDIDETRFVMEVAQAARAVCYTKGCFIGQEPIVMSRDRAGQVNRLFLGLKVLDGGPLPQGTKITRDGAEVGAVTSSCDSPRLGLSLVLAYLRRPHVETGLRLQAGGQTLEVLGYPPLQG